MAKSNRKDQIVRAATALIARRGIQNATIKNLAAEVGITEGAIYRHFASKQDILMAVLDQFQDQSDGVLTHATTTLTDPIQQIERFFMDRIRRFAADPELAKVMFSEAAFQNQADLAAKNHQIMHQHKQHLVAMIHRGQETGRIRRDVDATALFRLLIGGLRLLVTQWCFTGFSFDLVAQGAALWEAALTLMSPFREVP